MPAKIDIEQERELLYDLYINRKMTHKEISKETGLTKDQVQFRIKKLGLTRNMQFESYKVNDDQHDIIIGSIMGDGCITKSSANYHHHFAISHCEDQYEYLQFKFNKLKNLCNITDLKIKTVGKGIFYNAQKLYWFYTKHLPLLDSYKTMNVESILSEINNNSLIIWYLDDGHLRDNKYYYIHFSDVNKLDEVVDIFKSKFKIYASPKWKDKEHTILDGVYFNINESKKLHAELKKSKWYEDLFDCMSYKFIKEGR